MEVFLIVYQVVSLIFSLLFAWVIYMLMRGNYQFLAEYFPEDRPKPMLLKLDNKVTSIIFMLCFIGLVL